MFPLTQIGIFPWQTYSSPTVKKQVRRTVFPININKIFTFNEENIYISTSAALSLQTWNSCIPGVQASKRYLSHQTFVHGCIEGVGHKQHRVDRVLTRVGHVSHPRLPISVTLYCLETIYIYILHFFPCVYCTLCGKK